MHWCKLTMVQPVSSFTNLISCTFSGTDLANLIWKYVPDTNWKLTHFECDRVVIMLTNTHPEENLKRITQMHETHDTNNTTQAEQNRNSMHLR